MNMRLVLGLGLLVVGAGAIVDLAGLWDFGGFAATWWPALLVLFGLAQLLSRSGRTVGPAIVIAVGGFLLLRNLDLIRPGLGRYVWAVAALALGLALVLGSLRSRPRPTTRRDRLHRFAAFGGFEERVASRSFRGGDVTVLFGGGEVDLRQATLAPHAVLGATAVFGGVTVLVPPGTNVDLRGTPVLGAVENKVHGVPEGPHLRVEALAVFGGVEVRDRAR